MKSRVIVNPTKQSDLDLKTHFNLSPFKDESLGLDGPSAKAQNGNIKIFKYLTFSDAVDEEWARNHFRIFFVRRGPVQTVSLMSMFPQLNAKP